MCNDGTNKKFFFGLTRVPGVGPLDSIYRFDVKEYEIFFINNSAEQVTIKENSYGGFKTYEDVVVMATPGQEDVKIIVKPYSYVFYCSVLEDDLRGASQYSVVIGTSGGDMVLTFYLSGGTGFMGSLIPCVNRPGRIIRPQINNLNERR